MAWETSRQFGRESAVTQLGCDSFDMTTEERGQGTAVKGFESYDGQNRHPDTPIQALSVNTNLQDVKEVENTLSKRLPHSVDDQTGGEER